MRHPPGRSANQAHGIDDVIDRVGVHRIVGELSPQNHASARLLERLGLTFECFAEKSYWWRGAWLRTHRSQEQFVATVEQSYVDSRTLPLALPHRPAPPGSRDRRAGP